MKKAKLTGYRGRIINPKSQTEALEFRDGLLVVDDHGKIVACGPYQKTREKFVCSKIVDYRRNLIVPGLIDCHLHLPQLDCRGKHGSTLLGWLSRYIFPAEMAFKDLRVVDDVGKRFFKKLILNGTTTASIYVTVHAQATDHAFKLAKACGLRAIIGKVMMDQNSPDGLREDTNKSLKESEALAAKWHNTSGGRLRYVFTPRFAPTCSETLLKEIGKLAQKSGAYIQSHIAETKEENEEVKKLFPDYPDPFSVFERTGCATPKTILAHAIYLSDDEYRRMAKSGTKIAHCPTSNFFLKSGWMPSSRVEKAGVTYGLGTDVGAGTSMSIFTEMRHADYTQLEASITPSKAFYLATLGGAKTLSMENEIGNFEASKWADFLVLDIRQIDYHYRLSELSTDEILSLLMYRGDGRVVQSTYVGGKKLDVDALKLKRRVPHGFHF
ncbi:MAG: guanine deaminase [Candidatus Omnitrophota bacterium]